MAGRILGIWRLILVVLVVAAITISTLQHVYWLALTVGIGAGLWLFLRGMATGGALGNARQFEKKPADINTRIGICLAAAGIASASLGHDPLFPLPFRIFYTVALVLACVIALVLAGKYPS
jgi:peptidoglycan/LPS O-acetylase OafA/YrhL